MLGFCVARIALDHNYCVAWRDMTLNFCKQVTVRGTPNCWRIMIDMMVHRGAPLFG